MHFLFWGVFSESPCSLLQIFCKEPALTVSVCVAVAGVQDKQLTDCSSCVEVSESQALLGFRQQSGDDDAVIAGNKSETSASEVDASIEPMTSSISSESTAEQNELDQSAVMSESVELLNDSELMCGDSDTVSAVVKNKSTELLNEDSDMALDNTHTGHDSVSLPEVSTTFNSCHSHAVAVSNIGNIDSITDGFTQVCTTALPISDCLMFPVIMLFLLAFLLENYKMLMLKLCMQQCDA